MKRKRLALFLALLPLTFAPVSCSNNILCRFVLETPTIASQGFIINWEEVEYAEKYEIYNAQTNEKLDETHKLSYTFSDLVDDMEVYIKACFENNNPAFIDSNKSNTVKVSVPRLGTPVVSASFNTIYWQPVQYADYYRVYDSSSDECLHETVDTSYTFTNIDAVKRAYVIAFYKDIRRDSKKSAKSSAVDIAPDIFTIDVSSADFSGTTYLIHSYASRVTITGEAVSSCHFEIEERERPLTLVLDNLSLQCLEGNCFKTIGQAHPGALNFVIVGHCNISSLEKDAIVCSECTFTGTHDDSITLRGADGANGANGTRGRDGSSEGGSGYNGTDGANGDSGHHAIVADSITIENISFEAIGGNGGNGGHGGAGGTGGTGKTLVNILTGGKDGTKNYGGRGGNGGNGGNGGFGSEPITTSNIVSNSATINLVAGSHGNGGNGGNGGAGGTGGNYYNSLGSVWRCGGGSGGNGGNGGHGKIPGQGGKGGSIGEQGNGDSVNGLGLGINYGAVYSDTDNNATSGQNGSPGSTY